MVSSLRQVIGDFSEDEMRLPEVRALVWGLERLIGIYGNCLEQSHVYSMLRQLKVTAVSVSAAIRRNQGALQELINLTSAEMATLVVKKAIAEYEETCGPIETARAADLVATVGVLSRLTLGNLGFGR